MTRRYKFFAAVTACAALIAIGSAIAWPRASSPDLLAHSIKIIDPRVYGYAYEWVGGHCLLATKNAGTVTPSVVVMDATTGAILPLPAVTRSLRTLMAASHDDGVSDAVLSPDGRWILYRLTRGRSVASDCSAIRVRDGISMATKCKDANAPLLWLADSRQWAEKDDRAVILHSLSGSQKHGFALDVAGKKRLIKPNRYVMADLCDDCDPCRVSSPDGTRVAWLRESQELPVVSGIARYLVDPAGHYTSHARGELWTTRPDDTDRQEIGQFGADPPPAPAPYVTGIAWTPDGTSLVFLVDGLLYSVSASGGSTR